MANLDYPRMLFHRTQEPVTVHSRDEESALGPEWSRIIWPASPLAAPEPEPYSGSSPESEPEEEPAPDEPTRPVRAHSKPPAARHKKKG